MTTRWAGGTRGYDSQSSLSSPDERFYTPRVSGRGSMSSGSERTSWQGSARSHGSAFNPDTARSHAPSFFSQEDYESMLAPRSGGNLSEGGRTPDRWGQEGLTWHTESQKQTHPEPAPREGGGSGTFPFNQKEVEDIFSYARHNRVDDVQRMLDVGVPVDVRDQHGNSILIIACQNGHKRVAKAALRMGADVNATNHRGFSALHYCNQFGYGDTLGIYLQSKGAARVAAPAFNTV